MPALLTTNYPLQMLQLFSDCTNKDATIFNVTPRNEEMVEEIVT